MGKQRAFRVVALGIDITIKIITVCHITKHAIHYNSILTTESLAHLEAVGEQRAFRVIALGEDCGEEE